jgi:hypothetical protein
MLFIINGIIRQQLFPPDLMRIPVIEIEGTRNSSTDANFEDVDIGNEEDIVNEKDNEDVGNEEDIENSDSDDDRRSNNLNSTTTNKPKFTLRYTPNININHKTIEDSNNTTQAASSNTISGSNISSHLNTSVNYVCIILTL